MVTSSLTAKRYASALFGVGLEDKQHEELLTDFSDLIHAVDHNKGLRQIFYVPVMEQNVQQKVLLRMAKQAKWHQHFSSFLQLATRKRRLNLIHAIYDAFYKQVQQYRNEISAKITTATPMAKKDSEIVKKMIAEHLKADNIILEQEVDESLLGGFVVEAKSLRVDASVRGAMRRMERQLQQVPIPISGRGS